MPDEFVRKLRAAQACISADIDVPAEIVKYFKEEYGIEEFELDEYDYASKTINGNDIETVEGEDGCERDIIEIPLKDIPEDAIAIRVVASF